MINEIELLKKKISDELRKLRAEKGYTQEDVAEKSKVNIGTIVRYENGTVIQNLDKIILLLKVYEVTIDIFFESIYENMYR